MRLFLVIALLLTVTLAQEATADGTTQTNGVAFGSNCNNAGGTQSGRLEGEVTLRVRWNANGHIGTWQLVRSSGYRALDEATIHCISVWSPPNIGQDRYAPEAEIGITIRWQYAPSSGETIGYYHPGVAHQCFEYYPATERRNGQGGIAHVGFRINTSGKTDHLTIIRSSGNKVLDDAATTCVSRWRYKPALDDEKKAISVQWQSNIVWDNILSTEVLYAEPRQGCATLRKPEADELSRVEWYSVLRFSLTNGKATDIKIALSSGSDKLDRRAIECLSQWQFPTAKNGTMGRIKIFWKPPELETVVTPAF